MVKGNVFSISATVETAFPGKKSLLPFILSVYIMRVLNGRARNAEFTCIKLMRLERMHTKSVHSLKITHPPPTLHFVLRLGCSILEFVHLFLFVFFLRLIGRDLIVLLYLWRIELLLID